MRLFCIAFLIVYIVTEVSYLVTYIGKVVPLIFKVLMLYNIHSISILAIIVVKKGITNNYNYPSITVLASIILQH